MRPHREAFRRIPFRPLPLPLCLLLMGFCALAAAPAGAIPAARSPLRFALRLLPAPAAHLHAVRHHPDGELGLAEERFEEELRQRQCDAGPAWPRRNPFTRFHAPHAIALRPLHSATRLASLLRTTRLRC